MSIGPWLAAHGLTIEDLKNWDIEVLPSSDISIPILGPNGEEVMKQIRQFSGRKYDFQPIGSRHGYVLYGLDTAFPVIQETGTAIIVEGAADCIAVHKAGHRNAVSPLTSYLSRTQWAMLADMAKSVIVWLDGDEAGEKHCLDLIKKLDDFNHPKSVTFVTVDGYDPAELFADHGKKWVDSVLAIAELAGARYRYIRLTGSLAIKDDSLPLPSKLVPR